ncbi:MAG: spore germination protein GerW family protein, partial [Dehalococcoidia bacterium]
MTATQIPADVEREVTQAVSGPVDNLVEKVAERLGGSAGVAAVYGTPIERDGVTVIPVAKVRWGFGVGGGSGNGPEGSGHGQGGGGGAAAAPVGYIEIRDGEVRFR